MSEAKETPSADLMRLEQELRALAHKLHMLQRPQASARVLEVAAALSAPGEARVGGEAFVSIPRDIIAALPILHALSDAAGFDRLPDPGNEDGYYPITGQQSTVRQWYDAIIAAALATPAQPKASEPAESPEDRFEQFVQQAIANPPEPLRELAEHRRRVAAVEALCAAGWTWNGTFWDFPKASEACSHHFVRDDDAPLHHCCQKCGAVKNDDHPKASEAQPAKECAHRNWRDGIGGYYCEDCEEFMREYEQTPEQASNHPKSSEGKAGGEVGDTIRSGKFEWWVLRCPGYPDPISFDRREDALGLIRRNGDERTFLSCWWRQANRHDYTPEETRAMTATLTAPGADDEQR